MKKYLIIALVAAVAAFSSPYWSLDTYHNVKVTDKLVKGPDNLVYTNLTTFNVVDTYAFMRMNSSDFYGTIEVGQTYDIKASGWRFGWFSVYENIISITPSKSN